MARLGSIAFLVCWTAATAVAEDNVRHYQDGGDTYQETPANMQPPLNPLQYRNPPQTFYRDRYTTEIRDVVRNNYVPVTRYTWQPRWHGHWNILEGPHLAYHLVPYTNWELRQTTVQVPMTRREIVPETRSLRVPQTNLRSEDRLQVSRAPVGPSASHLNLETARNSTTAERPRMKQVEQRPRYGGVARLDSDPPRYGMAAESGN